MSEQSATNPEPLDKGKGKAVDQPAQDMSMDEDSSSDEEQPEQHEEAEEEDEDNMEEISTENIISDGRRTRGKEIDYAKAAAETEDLDDDEDDDEDFEEKDDDAMHD